MYTKGKWEVTDKWNVTSEDRLIASCGGYCDGTQETHNENIANAHLIAASPRMVQLLERLVSDGWNANISEEAKEILQTLA